MKGGTATHGRCLPALSDSPGGVLEEAGDGHQRRLGSQKPFIVYCSNHFIVQYLILNIMLR